MEARQVKDLMEAYASVYNQPERQEVLSEDLQSAVEKGLDAAAKNPVIKAIGEVIKPVGAGRKTPTKKSGGYRPVVKSVTAEEIEIDLFDLVKGHLVDEGFADTEEAALVIMANMSEEWRESIVESIARGSAPNSPTGTIGGAAGRVAGTLLQRGAELLKKNMPQSGGGYSTRPGDGKPYKDGPLWGPGSSDAPVRKPTPQRKPQGAPMRDEPLW